MRTRVAESARMGRPANESKARRIEAVGYLGRPAGERWPIGSGSDPLPTYWWQGL
jgi:hypothetical protein